MNGIIVTQEDAKFFKERGIVLNHLKSDKKKVADLRNGMSKSLKLTKFPKMDKVIEDVNIKWVNFVFPPTRSPCSKLSPMRNCVIGFAPIRPLRIIRDILRGCGFPRIRLFLWLYMA
ncbi:hypothetical protein CTI12_AA472170 [Artemisia annua]|uniref:Uncharacterized protein n=1 Tax=Artemisia annua TaxID=35608 RepID=A0A2U1LN82_ARTAN|nr:hypothetical protein CTI12_AA472170 [Artemisia annua]